MVQLKQYKVDFKGGWGKNAENDLKERIVTHNDIT